MNLPFFLAVAIAFLGTSLRWRVLQISSVQQIKTSFSAFLQIIPSRLAPLQHAADCERASLGNSKSLHPTQWSWWRDLMHHTWIYQIYSEVETADLPPTIQTRVFQTCTQTGKRTTKRTRMPRKIMKWNRISHVRSETNSRKLRGTMETDKTYIRTRMWRKRTQNGTGKRQHPQNKGLTLMRYFWLGTSCRIVIRINVTTRYWDALPCSAI